jgi:GxxExxY protein
LRLLTPESSKPASFNVVSGLQQDVDMLTDPHGTNQITRAIIGCGIEVHKVIGPGLYENVYSECMAHELHAHKLQFDLQRRVPLVYRGVKLDSVYYIDIVVEDCVVVELKAVASLSEIHRRQVLTQLKLAALPVGLLINFNVVRLVDGLKRVVNPEMRMEGMADDEI